MLIFKWYWHTLFLVKVELIIEIMNYFDIIAYNYMQNQKGVIS
jgi:hypothetical protein